MDEMFPFAFRYTVVEAQVQEVCQDDVRITSHRIPQGCIQMSELEIISNKFYIHDLDIVIWHEKPFFETVTYRIKIP